MRRTRGLFALLVVLVLLAAACGSSSSVEDVVAESRAASTSTTPVDEPDADSDVDPGESADADEAPDTDGEADPDADDQTGDIGDIDPDAVRVEQAARTAESESYRAEMFMVMSMGAEGFSFDMGSDTVPVATIAYDGAETAMDMDVSVMLGDLFGSLGAAGLGDDEFGFDPADLTMNMVMTEDTMYLHSPFLGVPGAAAADGWMQAAADGWISISLDQLTSSEALADFGEISGMGTTAGVDQFLDLLDDIEDVEALGASQVRGVDVEGYRVTVSMGEIMALQGASAEDLLGPEFVDLFDDFFYTYDVFIGAADDRLYAVDVVMDESLFDSLGEEMGEEVPADLDFEMAMRLELFDHASSDIDAVVPFGAVDVTDEFLAAASLGGLELSD